MGRAFPRRLVIPDVGFLPSGMTAAVMRVVGWWPSVPAQAVVNRPARASLAQGQVQRVMGNGQTSPPAWMPAGGGDESLGEWGCARPARGSNATRPRDRRRAEPYGGVPLCVRWGKVVQRSGGSGTHRAETRDGGVGGHAPTPPSMVRRIARGRTQGSRHAAQSSTPRQLLPETPRTCSGYPLRPVAGCRPLDWAAGIPATTPVPRQAGCHRTRVSWRTRGGEAVAVRA